HRGDLPAVRAEHGATAEAADGVWQGEKLAVIQALEVAPFPASPVTAALARHAQGQGLFGADLVAGAPEQFALGDAAVVEGVFGLGPRRLRGLPLLVLLPPLLEGPVAGAGRLVPLPQG